MIQQLDHISVKDYLAGERVNERRSEYIAGKICVRADSNLNHNRITVNLSALLWNALKTTDYCPLGSAMLIKTATDRFRYPDVVVVCNNDPSQDDYVRERPILVVEVISESTRRTDKIDKRLEYIALPSLLEYVLVEQDIAEVTVYRRSAGWQPSYYYLGQAVTLESINVTLHVEDIYARVENGELAKWHLEKLESAAEE